MQIAKATINEHHQDQTMPDTQSIVAAAVVYTPHTSDKTALSSFAEQIRQQGYTVGGIIQEFVYDENGAKIGTDAGWPLITGNAFRLYDRAKRTLPPALVDWTNPSLQNPV